MNNSSIDVAYIANLARIELTEQEATDLTQTIETILGHITQLQKYDVKGIEPTMHAVPVFDRVREDIVKPSLPIEETLSIAPQQGQGQIRVPKVVETA